MEDANGNKYLGQYKNGKKQGRGTIIYKNGGGIYEGYLQNDMLNGPGRVIWSNGEMFTGNFTDNLYSG